MSIRSVSFDDGSDEDLCVFSGDDLLLSHYDVVDEDVPLTVEVRRWPHLVQATA